MDFSEIARPRVEERIRLVEAIWDSIAADQAQLDLTETRKKDLDRRIAVLDANPNNVLTWAEIKARVRGQR